MLYRREIYDIAWVKCPQGLTTLGKCQECSHFVEIKRRRVYCGFQAKNPL